MRRWGSGFELTHGTVEAEMFWEKEEPFSANGGLERKMESESVGIRGKKKACKREGHGERNGGLEGFWNSNFRLHTNPRIQ